MKMQCGFHASGRSFDNVAGRDLAGLPDHPRQLFQRHKQLADDAALGLSKLGKLILVESEKRLIALDLDAVDSIDRDGRNNKRLGNDNLLPTASHSHVPFVRDFQSDHIRTGTFGKGYESFSEHIRAKRSGRNTSWPKFEQLGQPQGVVRHARALPIWGMA